MEKGKRCSCCECSQKLGWQTLVCAKLPKLSAHLTPHHHLQAPCFPPLSTPPSTLPPIPFSNCCSTVSNSISFPYSPVLHYKAPALQKRGPLTQHRTRASPRTRRSRRGWSCIRNLILLICRRTAADCCLGAAGGCWAGGTAGGGAC